MLRKLLRSSLLITLLLIVSVTLSGCSVDFSAIFSGIKTFIGNISGNLGEFVSKGINTVKGVVDTVKTVAKPIVDTAKNIFNNVKEKVDTVKGVIDTGKGIVKDVKDTVTGVIDTGKGLVNDVKGAVKDVKDTVKAIGKAEKDKIKTTAGQLKDVGINIVEGTKDAIGNTIDKVFTADKVASRDNEEPTSTVSVNTNTDISDNVSSISFSEWLNSLVTNNQGNQAVNTISVIKDENPQANAGATAQVATFIPTEEELEVLSERELAIVKNNIQSDATNLKSSIEKLVDELKKSELKDVADSVMDDVSGRLDTVRAKLDEIIGDPLNKSRVENMEIAAEEVEKILSAAQGYTEEIGDFSNNIESILDTCGNSFEGLYNNFTKVFGEDI
jgi:hypothetical protein